MHGLSDNISLYEFCTKNTEYLILLNMWSDKNYPLTTHDVNIRSFQLLYWNINGYDIQASAYGMIHRLKSEIYGRKKVEYSLYDDNKILCKEL